MEPITTTALGILFTEAALLVLIETALKKVIDFLSVDATEMQIAHNVEEIAKLLTKQIITITQTNESVQKLPEEIASAVSDGLEKLYAKLNAPKDVRERNERLSIPFEEFKKLENLSFDDMIQRWDDLKSALAEIDKQLSEPISTEDAAALRQQRNALSDELLPLRNFSQNTFGQNPRVHDIQRDTLASFDQDIAAKQDDLTALKGVTGAVEQIAALQAEIQKLNADRDKFLAENPLLQKEVGNISPTPSTEQPEESEPMDMHAYFDQKQKEMEQGATMLKAFFDELAPVTEQFGKLKDILSSLLAPEDMAALEAKTQAVAAKDGDTTAQDFNGLIEMLKQLLEKVNVILDPETGLLSPKEGSVPLVAPATGGGNATGEGPSTVQETQKKGEGIEAQLEAWDEIVRKFGENAVGAFQNMLESGEIMIYTFIGYLFSPVVLLFGREWTQTEAF